MSPPHDPAQQDALGQSDSFLVFTELLSRAAKVDRPVLIVGERGTGKELAARRLHFLSRRWQEPLIELNCSALAPTLIESELFGYEAGAFTGAQRRRRGRFEAANGGSLFLDELGNVPREVQEKILRVVEYGTFERVGSAEQVQVNARLIGATNVDLRQLVQAGRFMPDLLDRLSFEVLYLPPLRERHEDIALLANHFAAQMAYEMGRPETPELTAKFIAQLEAYPWPGNIRELKNVVERAVYRADAPEIDHADFDPFSCIKDLRGATLPQGAPDHTAVAMPVLHQPAVTPCFRTAVEEFELTLLRRALAESRFNQRKCAEMLQLTYHQFRALYRKHQAALHLKE